jgi:hypothetical protein
VAGRSIMRSKLVLKPTCSLLSLGLDCYDQDGQPRNRNVGDAGQAVRVPRPSPIPSSPLIRMSMYLDLRVRRLVRQPGSRFCGAPLRGDDGGGRAQHHDHAPPPLRWRPTRRTSGRWTATRRSRSPSTSSHHMRTGF